MFEAARTFAHDRGQCIQGPGQTQDGSSGLFCFNSSPLPTCISCRCRSLLRLQPAVSKSPTAPPPDWRAARRWKSESFLIPHPLQSSVSVQVVYPHGRRAPKALLDPRRFSLVACRTLPSKIPPPIPFCGPILRDRRHCSQGSRGNLPIRRPGLQKSYAKYHVSLVSPKSASRTSSLSVCWGEAAW